MLKLPVLSDRSPLAAGLVDVTYQDQSTPLHVFSSRSKVRRRCASPGLAGLLLSNGFLKILYINLGVRTSQVGQASSAFRDLERCLYAGKRKGGDPVTLSSVSLQPLPEPLWDRLVLGKVQCHPTP